MTTEQIAQEVAAVRWWKERTRRTVPDAYLRDCYRRLAKTQAQAQEHAGKCYSCRNAVAHVTWWCERDKAGLRCEWMACYSKDTITRADMAAGAGPVGGWLGLPATQVLIEQANTERSGAERPTGALSCVSCGTHEKGNNV